MNCAFDKEKLTGYYDGELDAAEKAEVERHIAACSECLRELGELKSAAILVKELPRLRAPRSIAEGVAREMQTAGKIHSFARMRRTILWASAAAAALFVGLNVMYFAASGGKSPVAASAPPVVGRIDGSRLQEEKAANAMPAGEKDAATPGRRAAADRASADEKPRESRKQVVEEQKELRAKAEEPAPVERAREKAKTDGLAKGAAAPAAKPAAEPAAPPKPMAVPPAPTVAKPAPAAPPPAAEAPATKKDAESPARTEAERKRGAAEAPAAAAAIEAPPTHLTLASTQLSKARPQVEEALRKMGVAVPAPAPAAKAMKSPRETEIAIPLELTDAQIARLRQELDKPGSSRILMAAPGDPVLAEFRDGRLFGKKESGASAAGGAGARSRDLGKADAPKDSKEAKDADPSARGLTEGAQGADKSAGEPRRRVILHLVEVPFVPDTQPAPDNLKK